MNNGWSPLNVPLMWAAAGEEGSHPVIEWLAEVAQRVREPLELPGGDIMTEAALRAGWTVLRSAIAELGFSQRNTCQHGWGDKVSHEFLQGTTSRQGHRSFLWERRSGFDAPSSVVGSRFS